MFTQDLEVARKTIFKEIKDSSIDVDHAKTFLVLYGEKITARLESDWISYGVLIGARGTDINIMSLVNIRKTPRISDSASSDAATEKDDPWMAVYLLGIYRMIRATVVEYKHLIGQKITNQLTAINKNSVDMTEVTEIYLGWVNDVSYNLIVAAYDMFFHRFQKHPLASLKIGTTPSRHRDCAALISYGYLMRLTGMKNLTDLMEWVFIDQVGDDIDRMYKEGEELEDPYSYFPYQVDLGLVTKSAYSASTNPLFFQWAHTIGALLRAPRSLNARSITDQQIMQILGNAGIVAYVYANVFEYTKVYVADGEKIIPEKVDDQDDKDKDDKKDDESIVEEPENIDLEEMIVQSADPNDWLNLIQTRSGRLPSKVRKFIASRHKMIKNPRVGTIEAHLNDIVGNLE